MNRTYVGEVANKDGKFKVFETYVPPSPDSTYIVELENCVGSSEIFVTDSFTDLLDNKFESRNSQFQYGKLYAPIPPSKAETKKYIIAVASNNERNGFDDLPGSVFKIEAR